MTEMISQREEREFFEEMYSTQIQTCKTNANRLKAIQQDGVCLVSSGASNSVTELIEARGYLPAKLRGRNTPTSGTDTIMQDCGKPPDRCFQFIDLIFEHYGTFGFSEEVARYMRFDDPLLGYVTHYDLPTLLDQYHGTRVSFKKLSRRQSQRITASHKLYG